MQRGGASDSAFFKSYIGTGVRVFKSGNATAGVAARIVIVPILRRFAKYNAMNRHRANNVSTFLASAGDFHGA